MIYGGMKKKNIEAKLNELNFKIDNNYTYGRVVGGFWNQTLLGLWNQIIRQKILAIDEKNIIVFHLSILANFSNKEPLILNRKDYRIEYKKGWFENKFEIISNENLKKKIKIYSPRFIIGFSWARKNINNIVDKINN